MYCSVSNDQFEFISNEEATLAIMKKFDAMYLKESSALQICVRNKPDKIKFLKN